MQGVEAVPAQPDPGGAREEAVHHLPPDAHRQPEGCLLLPRHRLDAEAGPLLGEDGATEQEQQRDLAVVEGLEVLGRGDLEVVGAGDRQGDLGNLREAGDHQRRLGPQQRLERLAPAPRLAEQLQQPLLLRRRIGAQPRHDLDQAAQGDGMDRRAAGRADPQPEGEGRHRGVGLGLRPDDGEGQLGHGSPAVLAVAVVLRARSWAKKASISCQASVPPWKPFQRRRMRPTSS